MILFKLQKNQQVGFFLNLNFKKKNQIFLGPTCLVRPLFL